MDRLDAVSRLAAIESSGVLLAAKHARIQELARSLGKAVRADCVQVNVVTATQLIFIADWPRPRLWRQPIAIENTGCREVVLAEHTMAISDTRVHPVTCVMPWITDWEGYLGTPIRHGDEIIGTLCSLSRKARMWTSDEVTMIQNFARRVSETLA